MKRITAILSMMIYSYLLLSSGNDTLYLEEVILKNDISIPNITHINHDKVGNLWITTLEGVYRYDGYDVIKYISNENESHGLIKDKVYRTHLSSDGNLWITGAYSIYRYDYESERIIRMTESARKNNKRLYNLSYFDIEDIDNNFMVVGTKAGLFIYDKDRQEVMNLDSLGDNYIVDSYSSNGHVVQIERDPVNSNLLWLLTRSGLYTFDCLTRTTSFVFYNKSVEFENLRDRAFSIIPTGEYVYFLTNHLNLFKYERGSGKCTRITQNFKSTIPNHIRNLMPHEDGFLIVYTGRGIHHYSLKEDKIKPVITLLEDGSRGKGMSYVGFDHEGKYTYIFNNQKLIKSKDRILPTSYLKKIFTKDMLVEGHEVYDTIKEKRIHVLESYERNLQFDIGLTNRNNGDKEQYFYRMGKNDDWISLNSNQILLQDLSAGKNTIYCKIISNDESYETLVKQFRIKPYFYETTWFALLLFLSFIGIVSIISYLIKKSKKDNKAYQRKMLELEMNSLRSQMNPHFLFNSINSIKSYVISNDKEEAAEYLTQFAKLIRMILENSRKKYLTMEEEIEMLKLYIIMEQKRLSYSFDFEVNIDSDLDLNFLIAPMLIQPYIENAIWHGLMNKYGEKKLILEMRNYENGVLCKVIDNGIGRAAAKGLQKENITSKKSLAHKITEDRIDIINKIYKIDASIDIIDLYSKSGEALGTEVKILLPGINELHSI